MRIHLCSDEEEEIMVSAVDVCFGLCGAVDDCGMCPGVIWCQVHAAARIHPPCPHACCKRQQKGVVS